MKTGLFALLLAAVFLSCDRSTNTFDASSQMVYAGENQKIGTQPFSSELSIEELYSERLLIKSGSIRFKTDNFHEAKSSLTALIKAYNGIIQSENTDRYDNSINLYLESKIPSNRFDAFVDTLEKVFGRPESRNIRVEDITRSYRDTESRIQNKKELENRYRDLIRQAKSVSEILEIEAKLNEVRFEIEQYEQMLKNFDNQLAYSTLSINIYQETRREFEFFKKIGNGLSEGWDNFLRFLVGVVYLWPFVLLVLIVMYVLKIRRKRRT